MVNNVTGTVLIIYMNARNPTSEPSGSYKKIYISQVYVNLLFPNAKHQTIFTILTWCQLFHIKLTKAVPYHAQQRVNKLTQMDDDRCFVVNKGRRFCQKVLL